jgi:PBSX family phage terminase large subunit
MTPSLAAADLALHRPFAAVGSAIAMWKDRSLEVVLEGAAGTGKTRAVLEKLHFCASKYAGMRGLIVRKTRESMTESVLVTFEEKVLPQGSPISAGASRRTRASYSYPNGSEIVVAGLVASGKDQKAKVMSTEYDMIIVCEATELTEDEWEKLATRLRNHVMPYQQIVGECNPDAPSHWLHRRCDRGDARAYFSRHTDNPMLFRDGDWTAMGRQYVLGTLSKLTGVRRARLLEGKRAQAEGMVYDAFDRAIHVIDPFPIPKHWTRIRSIDFGFTNPMTIQWWCIDDDGRMYLYREIYMSNRTVARHIETIRAVEQWYLPDGRENPDREKISVSVADHDAEDRQTLAEGRIETRPAEKAVSRGIQKVQERLLVAGDGKPRLFLMRGALVERDSDLDRRKVPACTEEEFENYVWPKGGDGRSIKEEPVKQFDHGMDAMRYAVMRLDGARSSGVGLSGIFGA